MEKNYHWSAGRVLQRFQGLTHQRLKFWYLQKSARSSDSVKQLSAEVVLKALGHTSRFSWQQRWQAWQSVTRRQILAGVRHSQQQWIEWDYVKQHGHTKVILLPDPPPHVASYRLLGSSALPPSSGKLEKGPPPEGSLPFTRASANLSRNKTKQNQRSILRQTEKSAKDNKDLTPAGSPTNPSQSG